MKLYQLKVFVARKLESFWYCLMKPLAHYYSTEKINAIYNKRKSKITEELMIKWISQDIIRYLIKNRKSVVEFMVCSYANEEHFWSDCYLNGVSPYYIKRAKTRMAFYKFTKSIEIQEKIIDELKASKYINVLEYVEDHKWRRVDDYVKNIEVRHNEKG